jgi:hypothetical protein
LGSKKDRLPTEGGDKGDTIREALGVLKLSSRVLLRLMEKIR